MTRVIYGLIKEEYRIEGQARRSYGIAAYDGGAEGHTAGVIASVHDLSADPAEVADLVALCNRNRLSVLHLQDIAEDFFSK